jgi:hypothetical protein
MPPINDRIVDIFFWGGGLSPGRIFKPKSLWQSAGPSSSMHVTIVVFRLNSSRVRKQGAVCPPPPVSEYQTRAQNGTGLVSVLPLPTRNLVFSQHIRVMTTNTQSRGGGGEGGGQPLQRIWYTLYLGRGFSRHGLQGGVQDNLLQQTSLENQN